MARPMVSVLIVTYESAQHIGKCLANLRLHAADCLRDVVVVDNASTDGSADLAFASAPQAAVIRNGGNLGFGRAMNIGAQSASGEYLLLLNPDCALHAGCVPELAHFLDHRLEAGACGPKMLTTSGRFDFSSRRGFPTPLNAFAYFSHLDRLFPRSHTLGGYQRRHVGSELEIETDALSGACMLVRRSVFEEVGGFDEDYFLFGDDIDLCWKIRRAGHEIWYIPTARVTHAKGASMVKQPELARREFYRSMHLFVDKRLRERYSIFSRMFTKAGIHAASLWAKTRGRR
jgi:hypothetical protein